MSQSESANFFVSKNGENFFVDSHGNKVPEDELSAYFSSLSQKAKLLLLFTELGRLNLKNNKNNFGC